MLVHAFPAEFCVLQALSTLRVALGIGSTFRTSWSRFVFGHVLLRDWYTALNISMRVRKRFVMRVVRKLVKFEVVEFISTRSLLRG